MRRRPPCAKRTDTLFPYTTLCLSSCRADGPMGPGNKCRDDSLFVARASPPCARCVNAAGTTPEATAVCIQVVTAAVAGDSDIHSAVHEAPLRMPAPIDFYFDFSSP